MSKVRIGIAEDHPLVQYGLAQLLSIKPEYDIVAFSRCGEEARCMAATMGLDIMILDIHMPGTNAMDLLTHITRQQPAPKIVVYSGYPETRYALPMYRLGAQGYVEKSSDCSCLVIAIECVLKGKGYFSAATQHSIASFQVKPVAADDCSPALTPRQFQIFIRLASGEKVSQIARSLGVSIVTVSTHRATLLKKLKLVSNQDLTRYAVENSYVT